ncbi:TPA: 30S ribosomal protein S21 [Candidatus Dojkabacteria bacterium]|uniref:Small ribosomal subunit protein bS21 n=1 Tax=Candidatus Dojkabacteria bacterium TaxID=2099670 RepID=A0A832R9P4_9BACT|nr:30S ribosomal protein S21 [Candidatus Dojkabacteria bacterium]
MAVIVHSNENIDSALRRLHREVLREKTLETFKNKQYRIKKSDLKIAKRKEWAKRKRRRRAAARRAR